MRVGYSYHSIGFVDMPIIARLDNIRKQLTPVLALVVVRRRLADRLRE